MSNIKPLFSIILAHYNQFDLVFEAIDSVLAQTYENIELIVADDHSEVFDKIVIEDYIEKNNKGNIRSTVVQVNEKNLGTVRSLNVAAKAAKGTYLQFFAADDRLHDEDVVSNFADEFGRLGDEAKIIEGHAMVMDVHLTPPGEYNMLPRLHIQFGDFDAKKQFEKLAFSCSVAMGAICIRKETLEEIGYFSERYRLIEDWSFFIILTREGIKIDTAEFIVLDHRHGGVSRAWIPGSKVAIQYQTDIVNTIEHELIPYLDRFSIKLQHELIEKYNECYAFLVSLGGIKRKLSALTFLKYSLKVVIWRFCAKWRWKNDRFLRQSLFGLWASLLLYFCSLQVTGDLSDSLGILSITMLQICVELIAIGIGIFFAVNVFIWLSFRIWQRIKYLRNENIGEEDYE